MIATIAVIAAIAEKKKFSNHSDYMETTFQCVNLAMWTPFGTVAEMNKYERVLEPTEMEVTFKEYKEKILVHQTLSDNRTGTMFAMYDFCRPRPLLFILKRCSGT